MIHSPKSEEFLNEIKELNKQQLMNLKIETDLALADVHRQLLEARARRRTTNIFSDPTWYAKATAAVRFLSWKSQAIQVQLSSLPKESRHLALAEQFMVAARALLPADQFYMLLNEAEALLNESQS